MATEKMAPALKLSQVALPTRNMAAAREFYRDTLGLNLKFEAGGMAFFDLGGITLMIGPAHSKDKCTGDGALYFTVDDIKGAARDMAARGVTFIEDPEVVQRTPTHELWLHFFQDPDGNLLALMGHVPVTKA